MNQELLAAIKVRRKQIGQEPQQKQKVSTQPKTQKIGGNQNNFSDAKKLLEANLFKPNVVSERPVQPKEQIKGNSDNMKNAKALLQANLNFGGEVSSSGNNGGFNLPPPPPPPPSLNNLPNIPPPPPSFNLPNLPPPPQLSNLPPPPVLNLPPPPPPPSFNTTQNNKPSLNNTTKQPVNKLPPPPPINNFLPPPLSKPIIQQKSYQSNRGNVQSRVSNQKTVQKSKQFQSNFSTNSDQANQQQFQKYENNVKQQSSAQKKKGIFINHQFTRSSNQQYSHLNQINKKIQSGSNQRHPNNIPLNQNNFSNPQNPQNNLISRERQNPNQIKTNNLPPPARMNNLPPQINNLPLRPPTNISQSNNVPQSNVQKQQKSSSNNQTQPNKVDNQKRNRIFPKQNLITADFFEKDVSGFIKRQFIKKNDILSYIDKKAQKAQKKSPVQFSFPSILKGTRDAEPHLTLYVDTKVLNLAGSFMVNNLNCLKDHSTCRQAFEAKLKTYDMVKDPQKLNLRAIKQLADAVPEINYKQPNMAKISYYLKKCDSLIKQKANMEQFEQCTALKNIKDYLIKIVTQYCNYPEDNSDGLQKIERTMSKIKDLQGMA